MFLSARHLLLWDAMFTCARACWRMLSRRAALMPACLRSFSRTCASDWLGCLRAAASPASLRCSGLASSSLCRRCLHQ